jgi:hypothetical protein
MIITTQNRTAFRNILERSTLNRVTETACALEDSSWSDGELKMSELPRTLPTAVRTQVRALLEVQCEVNKALEDLQNELSAETELVLRAKETAEELAKPHCAACGQVLRQVKRR